MANEIGLECAARSIFRSVRLENRRHGNFLTVYSVPPFRPVYAVKFPIHYKIENPGGQFLIPSFLVGFIREPYPSMLVGFRSSLIPSELIGLIPSWMMGYV